MKRSDRRSSRGKNGDDTGWVRLKLPIATDPGQIQYAVDRGVSDATDVPPATMHLFLWRSGDDLSCNGVMASYRFWAPSDVTLKLGDSQTLTSVLDPSVWTNCYGQHDPSGFAGALENAMGIGFTFGGQKFFGHGVYLTSGSATFKVNSYTVR